MTQEVTKKALYLQSSLVYQELSKPTLEDSRQFSEHSRAEWRRKEPVEADLKT